MSSVKVVSLGRYSVLSEDSEGSVLSEVSVLIEGSVLSACRQCPHAVKTVFCLKAVFSQ